MHTVNEHALDTQLSVVFAMPVWMIERCDKPRDPHTLAAKGREGLAGFAARTAPALEPAFSRAAARRAASAKFRAATRSCASKSPPEPIECTR